MIKMFLKFGNEVHLTDLYDHGTIFMNPIQHFRQFEDAELRGDKYEGISEIKNYPPGTFEIQALNFKGNYLNIHLKKSLDEVWGNIYSLYCVSSFTFPNPLEFAIDKRVTGFGTHCLMVKDNKAFLDRIEKALKKKKLNYYHGFVSYYDRFKVNSKISLFEKPLEFKYQNEFRFYVENDDIKPVVIKIGSLHDIAQLVSIQEIMSLRLVVNN